MYVVCTVDNVGVPAIEVRLWEGYNQGWTVGARFPAANINAASNIVLQVNDGTASLALDLEAEDIAEDIYGLEATFRDKATRRLAHSKYDGSSLHCISADTAISRICTASGVSKSGNTGFGTIHYAATDEQESLDLLTTLLDTCAAYYNSNGSTLTIRAAHNTVDRTINMVSATESVDFEQVVSKIILNKVTPCDVVEKFSGDKDFETTIRAGSLCKVKPLFTRIDFVSYYGNLVQNRSVVYNTAHISANGYACILVGVSSDNCPADCDASFTMDLGSAVPTILKWTNRTSTIWYTQAQANARASYYLWLENQGYRVVKLTSPLNLAIRAGDVIAYGDNNYRITAVTHSLTATATSTEVDASMI